LTSYNISLNNSDKFPAPPLLQVNSDGVIKDMSNSEKFCVQDMLFTRMKRDCVVNLCPHIPVNDSDERSCYSTLLVHIPWPSGGEKDILGGFKTAVECLNNLKITNQIPQYVANTLELLHQSYLIRENVGTPENTINEIADEYVFDDNSAEYNINDNEISMSTPNDDETSVPITTSNNVLGVLDNISIGNKMFFSNFIATQQNKHLHKLSCENSAVSLSDSENSIPDTFKHVKVNNEDERSEKLLSNVKMLTKNQLKAYNKAVEYINGDKGSQLIMFVTGEGGTGKSFLISLIMEYTNIYHGKQHGLYGSALAIAPTGAAANIIKGFTWHSVYGKGKFKSKSDRNNDDLLYMSPESAKAVGAKLLGVKLIILDEISMINLDNLNEISARQIQAMCTQTSDESERRKFKSMPFGGVHILFTGDFYQLRPISGEPIYTPKPYDIRSVKGRKIWDSLNEFVMLTENTRYMGDSSPIMNKFLSGARKGIVNLDLLHAMNSRLVLSESECAVKKLAGPDAVWIAHTNEDVDRLNDQDFLDKVQSGVSYFKIRAKHLPTNFSIPRPSADICLNLLKIYRKDGTPPCVNLAIGSKVSCTRNLGTQIGTIISYIPYYMISCI
jgi:ATP-dependent DNA helicase PIF1